MRMNDIRLPICALAILASLVAGCDYDGDGFRDGLFGGGPRDCDGHDPNIHPGATEVCDGVDNDCDDEIDEHGLRIWVDDDRDGFGGEDHRYVCSLAIPSGFAVASGDCDDTVAAIRPWAAEICDGVDNDCDGSIDEGDLEAWYPDDDGDGYGRDDDPLRSCLRPDGHTEVGARASTPTATACSTAPPPSPGCRSRMRRRASSGCGGPTSASRPSRGSARTRTLRRACSWPPREVTTSAHTPGSTCTTPRRSAKA